jgi:hypothetical protein
MITFFRFVKGAMNIIDLAGIFPYFMSLSLSLITDSGGVSEYLNTVAKEYRIPIYFVLQYFLLSWRS